MHVMLFVATLATLFMTGHARYLKGSFFCGQKCNPKPDEPLKHCMYRCSTFKIGTYYDGHHCWILGRVGNHFQWRGNCKKGFCVKSRVGYNGSEAEKHCAHLTTTAATGEAMTTASIAIPTPSSNASGPYPEFPKANASLPLSPISEANNASTTKNVTSPPNPPSKDQGQEMKTPPEEFTVANGATQASSATKRPPSTSADSVTTSTEGLTNSDATTTVLFPKQTMSANGPKSITSAEDTTRANSSLQEKATAITLLITEVPSQSTSTEKNTEDSQPTTTTYPPRPSWLIAKFATTTTTQKTSRANATADMTPSSTAEARSVDMGSTVSTKNTQTPETMEKTVSTTSPPKESVGKNSRDDSTVKTTAVPSASIPAC